ncbi:MAG: SemiSWEET transporter [Chloroflexi bacterium]|nr:SemiSWEET transporter [Chloroflexota bacterium]
MSATEVLGFVAGALTTLGVIPQVVRVFRLRSAREISLAFTLMLATGTSLWLSYGVVRGLTPLIYWNVVSLALFALLLYAKLRYGR